MKEYKRCALQLYLDEIRADIERLKLVDLPDARNDMKRNLEMARVRLNDLQNQYWPDPLFRDRSLTELFDPQISTMFSQVQFLSVYKLRIPVL